VSSRTEISEFQIVCDLFVWFIFPFPLNKATRVFNCKNSLDVNLRYYLPSLYNFILRPYGTLLICYAFYFYQYFVPMGLLQFPRCWSCDQQHIALAKVFRPLTARYLTPLIDNLPALYKNLPTALSVSVMNQIPCRDTKLFPPLLVLWPTTYCVGEGFQTFDCPLLNATDW
jgi:hypothetical protein